jgi:inner membrane protein
MSDAAVNPSSGVRAPPTRRGADWGGKALLVCALALLMAIPGVFVFALISERANRAEGVVREVSALQGGPQQVLGPVLVAPYTTPSPDGKTREGGWYVVSPEQGSVTVKVKTSTLRRGIIDVPIYNATADFEAKFAPPPAAPNLPADAQIAWNEARLVVGFTDLRGAKTDMTGAFVEPSGKTVMTFAPTSNLGLGASNAPPGVARHMVQPVGGDGFGLVAAPAGMISGSPTGGVFRGQVQFTGAQRLAVMPFAKSTTVSIAGDWSSPSFDGGFLPATRKTDGGAFNADWKVPFMARGLSDHGVSNALSLGALGQKDLGVSFVRTNNPYQNVTRALKYAVMFVGLVFLTFFVFEALSGRRVHPAQYVLIGLAQMVFYLLLLSLSEYLGFDLAFAIAAVATVGLIGLYAGWAFDSAAYRVRALIIFSLVYGLIYLLMRLEDFALLAGSIASFIGLSTAMYLTRRIDWYGGRAEAPATPA